MAGENAIQTRLCPADVMRRFGRRLFLKRHMRILCELCHERHATVHLTQKALGQPDRRRDLCEVCFPLNTSQEEQSEMMRRLFKNQPPDEPDGSKDNDHAA